MGALCTFGLEFKRQWQWGGSKVLSRGEEKIYILSPLLSIHSVLALYSNQENQMERQAVLHK